MKTIFKQLKGYIWLMVLSIVLITIMVVAQLWQPNILKDIINEIAQNNTERIGVLGGQLILIALVGLVAGVANTFIAAKVSQRVGSSLRQEIFHKVQEFSFNNIEKFSASNLVVRLTNDTAQVQNLVMMLLQSLIRIPLMFIISFIFAMSILPEFWWIIVLMVAILFFAMMMTFGILGPKFQIVQELIEKVNTAAKENFLGIRVVKSFVQEDKEISKFTTTSETLTKEIIQIGMVFSVIFPIILIVSDGATALAVGIAGTMIESDPAIISNVVAFASYLSRIMMAIIIGGTMMNFAARAFVSLHRIEEVLNTEPDLVYGSDDATIDNGTIIFDNVSFSYEDSNEATLENVSFEIEHGQTIGIIGATGSGKTTLAQLMSRIYDATSGEILIGGKNIKTLSSTSLHTAVSIVLQRPILFSGTIASNIQQGKEDATLEEMEHAAQIAQAYDFITALPNKFEDEVYQRGANFSGGQKQRISITRGIVGNPKILVLDDSTSALDAKSEKLVKEAIDKELTNTTKVIVSQKISSIVKADNIIVLDEGKLVGIGKHKELIQDCPIYQEIYATQKGKGGHQ